MLDPRLFALCPRGFLDTNMLVSATQMTCVWSRTQSRSRAPTRRGSRSGGTYRLQGTVGDNLFVFSTSYQES